MNSLLFQPPTLKNTIAVKAPAKVNLTLDVLRRRPDQFHELRSVVLGVDLSDRVEGSLTTEPELSVDCSDSSISGPMNLAYRSVQEFRVATGIEPRLRLRIEKSIPLGGGLGGGSSDAAAALRIANHLHEAVLTDEQLARIGAAVGSDVPLFFHLPAAWMTGRGECVESVTLKWKGWVLLVFVGPLVPTSKVYANWLSSDASEKSGMPLSEILEAESAEELMALSHNDLEAAVFRVCPAVGAAMSQLRQHGPWPFCVSGAGSTLFRLYDEQEEALHDAAKIEHLGVGMNAVVVAAPISPRSIVS